MVRDDTASERSDSVLGKGGKHLIFRLAREEYGVAIHRVLEIIRLSEITRVPLARSYIRGVFNLRGKVYPVLDLRCRLGFGMTETTDQTVIIMVQYSSQDRGDQALGFLVDEVLEVLTIAREDIEPAPAVGSDPPGETFVRGVGKQGSRIIFLLDIDSVVGGDVQQDQTP